MMWPMDFGIGFANTGPFTSTPGAVEMAQAAEQAGFESVWTVEHAVVPKGYESTYPYSPTGKMPGNDDAPVPDPLIWLTYLAAKTTTLRVATGILILPQRNPVVLAKELATLDDLSGGRLELGIGVGWLAEEFAAIGVPFEGRGHRTDEYVAALRSLWTEDVASFSGEFTSFADCISQPSPVRGSVPIHVGGHTDASAKRAGRLGDGYFPGAYDHAEIARLVDIARNTAADCGRDPEALVITSGGRGAIGPGALDEVQALAALGVDRVIVPAFVFYEDPAGSLAAYGADVIAKA